MTDEKDRFGSKLKDVEKAREDQWAKQQDDELLEKMRHRKVSQAFCPKCKKQLAAHVKDGVGILACPDGHGAWIEGDQVENFLKLAK
ncbi:MAG: hypothetical protein JWM69_462 [Candidatus Binatus sp.]|jgi:hypothetical protein|nr:hypothetical protein [Candidatus Binatus sp.]